MEDELEHRFSIDEVYLDEQFLPKIRVKKQIQPEENKNLPVMYNNDMMMNTMPQIHADHPNPNMRPKDRNFLIGVPTPAYIQKPEVKKIAVINPLVKKPRPPSLFMKKVTY
jgi:hypothetical protein